jgi:hypothetical protein
MSNPNRLAAGDRASGRETPPARRLLQILREKPEARSRVGRAVAGLLGTTLVALAAVGGLLIWHLARRGRLIRDRLNPPRNVRLPEWAGSEDLDHDQGQGEVSSPRAAQGS